MLANLDNTVIKKRPYLHGHDTVSGVWDENGTNYVTLDMVLSGLPAICCC